MKLAFIIDPLDALNPKKDSSLDFMLEALRRGHQVSVFEYSDVRSRDGRVFARSTAVTAEVVALTAGTAVRRAGTPAVVPLSEFQFVFIRKDPPFDTQYLALTYLLDVASGETRFVNSPRGLREVNEKLFANRYAQHAPSTVVTWDLEEARSFAAGHTKVVLKPTFLGSGSGVFLTSVQDENFEQLFRTVLRMESLGPVVVQAYMPEGKAGDTRVFLLDGEPVAALGRRPPENDFRANVAQGGTAFATTLSATQASIARELGVELKQAGIVFAGLDFIGDRLIETNVTSPTLIQELRRLSGFDMSKTLLDHLGIV